MENTMCRFPCFIIEYEFRWKIILFIKAIGGKFPSIETVRPQLKRFRKKGIWHMKMIIYCLIVLFLAGCASNSGVAPIGKDTYMVSRQAATGFSGSGDLKAQALREANEYCLNQKKVLQVIHTEEAKPPFIFGNFPKAEIQFMCLDSNDPELARPKLRKEPDNVIEIRK